MTDHDAKVREAVDTGKAGGVRDKLFAFAMELGASHPRYITLLNACLILESIAESIAAARAQGAAEERARCVAVVEKAQRYEGETRFGLSGHTMERNEWGDWLDRDSTLAALRGTEEG